MLTPEQVEFRKSAIGGSDIPVLLDVARSFGGSQKSRFDLWLEKTGRVEAEDLSGNKAVEAGNYIEAALLKYASDHLGKVTTRNLLRRATGLPIRSNIDGILVGPKEPVECKAEGLMWETRDGWGEEGTGNVPFDIIAQCHGHMIALNADVCHVVALLHGRGFCIFKVEYERVIAEEIIDRAIKFWHCVTTDTPPDKSAPTEPYIKRRERNEGEIVQVNDVLVDTWQEMKAAAAEAKKREDEAKLELLTAMGDGEIVESYLGRVSYLSQNKTNFNKKQCMIDNPGLLDQYVTTSSHRVLRFKKAKVR
jgi:predicted phage-related endonuclease